MTGRTERYDTVAILFHWLIAILIVANVGLAWSLDSFDEHSPAHDRILTVHKSIGTTLLVLAVLRLAWRWKHPGPPLPETIAPWRRVAARLDQGLLYALLVILPLSGLLDAGAFSQPVHYFFLFDLPTLTGHNEPLGHAAFAVHKAAAVALYALLFLHAAAALQHHYVLKDDILRRMLP
ncbi:MAG: cytochrome b [Rhodospirillales bacterium]|nr:cytochrome b [Rhodospirillales bacterium]